MAGEGGIGKTRLAAELTTIAESDGALVLQARCHASERSLFLQPLVDAIAVPLGALSAGRLRELAGPRAGALAALLPELAEVLGPVAAALASPEVELRRIHEVVTAVLRGLGAQRPVVLVVDDLHNAGLATVELLHYLARHCAEARLLVLATVRARKVSPPLPHWPRRQLDWTSTRSRRPPWPACRRRGPGGHAEMSCAAPAGTPCSWSRRSAPSPPGRRPHPSRCMPGGRLRRVDAATGRCYGPAVLGAAVEPALVARMLDLPVHTEAVRCERAAAARPPPAGRAYEFANDLMQEVLYTTTPAPTRIAHHLRATERLADRKPSPRTQQPGDRPRAARAFLAAGEQAERVRHRRRRGPARPRPARWRSQAADAELIARAYLARGRAREALGSFRAALGDHQAAAATARRAGDRRLEMQALRELGGHTPVISGVAVDECADRLRQGLRIAEALGDPAAQADLLGFLSVLATNRLRFTQAVESSGAEPFEPGARPARTGPWRPGWTG